MDWFARQLQQNPLGGYRSRTQYDRHPWIHLQESCIPERLGFIHQRLDEYLNKHLHTIFSFIFFFYRPWLVASESASKTIFGNPVDWWILKLVVEEFGREKKNAFLFKNKLKWSFQILRDHFCTNKKEKQVDIKMMSVICFVKKFLSML